MTVIDLKTIKIDKGGHDGVEQGVCVMELASVVRGRSFSDHPSCVSPIIGSFLRRWNDDLDDEARQKLKRFVDPDSPVNIYDTAGDDGHDELRGWLCADWLVRVHTPAWLELAGIADSAAALRALPPLRDPASLDTAQSTISDARSKAHAAGDAAWAAARAAARDAAWAAAWASAWAALKHTTESLQASALELVERLIDPVGKS